MSADGGFWTGMSLTPCAAALDSALLSLLVVASSFTVTAFARDLFKICARNFGESGMCTSGARVILVHVFC